jgi:hypothetical protein
MFGSIDHVIIRGVVSKDRETDAELRRRVAYVGADGNYLTRRIETAVGADLDELAEQFGLKRR